MQPRLLRVVAAVGTACVGAPVVRTARGLAESLSPWVDGAIDTQLVPTQFELTPAETAGLREPRRLCAFLSLLMLLPDGPPAGDVWPVASGFSASPRPNRPQRGDSFAYG